MKIAVSADGPGLEAGVDPRFGRCRYFIVVDPETMQFETLENTSAMATGGAGIGTAQIIANKGVKVVLTGNCGPNAYQTLSAAGVQVITGATGTVKEAVEAYKDGRIKPTAQSNVPSHFGTGQGMGMGRGMGMRRTGMGMPAPPPMSNAAVETLTEQLRSLNLQLQKLNERISELERKRK